MTGYRTEHHRLGDCQVPADALNGGAGTSTNMNVNEVLANRDLASLGRPVGDYATIHPLEDVNLHQSTNDTYPTALRVAAIRSIVFEPGLLTEAEYDNLISPEGVTRLGSPPRPEGRP